jgi:hypothetical protein
VCLLAYLAMRSLRDVAHDGVLCTFGNRSAPRPGQVVWSIRALGMDCPSRTNHTLLGPVLGQGHSPSASQAGRRVGSAL